MASGELKQPTTINFTGVPSRRTGAFAVDSAGVCDVMRRELFQEQFLAQMQTDYPGEMEHKASADQSVLCAGSGIIEV
jgi:hypothetical protein